MKNIDNFYKRLGQALKERREFMGVSQQTISEAVGVTRMSIIHIERGQFECRFNVGLKYCMIVGVEPKDYIGKVIDGQELINAEIDRKISKVDGKISKLEKDIHALVQEKMMKSLGKVGV